MLTHSLAKWLRRPCRPVRRAVPLLRALERLEDRSLPSTSIPLSLTNWTAIGPAPITNGAPYSNKAVVTEYWELHALPNKDQWMTVTTKVDDPVYLTRPYLTSSDFKKLPNATGWNPTPCNAK